MDSKVIKKVQVLDEGLASLVKGVDILDAVAPSNFKDAKELFFENACRKDPVFQYKKGELDVFQRKRALFNLPVDEIADVDLQELYISIINSYVDKIDQYASVNTHKFLYDSFRYYGEPHDKDVKNAKFILHLPDEQEDEPAEFDANAIITLLKSFAEREGYEHEVRLEPAMIANALVSGTTIKVNSQAKVSEMEANALAHHELGVHLVTTLNARAQPLKILALGSPVNTMTQEGLAILNEYLAGCLSLRRLKVLALRVMAVNSLKEDKAFRHTFALLHDGYGADADLAFTITARVYRGGGFTKDYLYLRGFREMLNAYEQEESFVNLLAGKVSLDQLGLVTRLIEKGYLNAPKYVSPAITNPVKNDEINRFIAHAIR